MQYLIFIGLVFICLEILELKEYLGSLEEDIEEVHNNVLKILEKIRDEDI